jgi:CoA:oxalate CoA-transferase
MILSDLGAEVIRVNRADEPAEARGNANVANGHPATMFSVQRGKKSVKLDLKDPRAVEIAMRMAERVDILTENFSAGTMPKLGLDYEAVYKRNPKIIYASCSGFGQYGPYSDRGAVDVIIQAMCGIMGITGEPEPDGRPMRIGASFADSMSGAYMTMAVLAALAERERSGMGQYVDVAMMEAMMYHVEEAITNYSITGEVPKRIGAGRPRSFPFQPFPTKDGWISIAGVRDWQAFAVVLGLGPLAEDPGLENVRERFARREELELAFNEALAEKTTAEWMELLSGVCLAGPVYNMDELVNDPQVKAHGGLLELPVPGQEDLKILTPNVPMRFSRTPPKVEKAGPLMGEHTREVFQEFLGMPDEELAELEAAGVIRGLGAPVSSAR